MGVIFKSSSECLGSSSEFLGVEKKHPRHSEELRSTPRHSEALGRASCA